MSKLGVVVPCYNEVTRLNFAFFEELVERLDCVLIFVDDGSTDGTDKLLEAKSKILGPETEIFVSQTNRGKAVAISIGLEIAMKKQIKSLIFCDADNSLSVDDIDCLYRKFIDHPGLDIVSGARVPLAGSNVVRRDFRKWIGRIVATIVSRMTNIAIYDPMSPLKIYNLDRLNKGSGYTPSTRWLGEVELMFYSYNIDRKSFRIEELPLDYWRDQEGGHIGIHSAFTLLRDFIKLRKKILDLGDKPHLIHRSIRANN